MSVRRPSLAPVARALAGARAVDPRTAAGLPAALVVAVMTALRVANNAPGPLPSWVRSTWGPLVAGSLVVPALAALTLGVASERPLERVALVFVGVFGCLAALSSAAAVPAGLAAVGGTLLVAADRLGRPATPVSWTRWAAAGLLAAAAALALAATVGVAPATLRPHASATGLLGVAATAAFVRPTTGAASTGALTGVAVLAAGASAPFVTGAATLVGWGVVGGSTALVALAAAGGVAALAAAVHRRRVPAAAGAVLVLAVGVPAAVAEMVAMALGVALLAGGERA